MAKQVATPPTIVERQSATIEAVLAKRQKVFGDKFDPVEIASAEEADANIKYLYVPDVCSQWALGRPGYALGRIMHLLGIDGCGKTSAILELHRLAYDAGGFGAAVETELAIQVEQGRSYLGPHWSSFQQMFNQPDSFENGLQMLVEYMAIFESVDPKGLVPKVLSFDTIAGSGTERVVGGGKFDVKSCGSFGEKANMLRNVIEHLKPKLRRNNVLLVLGNQAKEVIETNPNPMARKREIDKMKGQGGRSTDFGATYWIYVKKTGSIAGGEGSSGFHQRRTFRKNKLRTPDRYIDGDIVFYSDRGYDYSGPAMTLLAAAKSCDVVKSAGGYYHCDAIGVTTSNKMRAREIYELIHQPENVGKFIGQFDILPWVDPNNVFFPVSWGGKVPVIEKKDSKEAAVEAPDPTEQLPVSEE